MFVHAVPVNLASRLLALPSWQAVRQLSGEDLKLLIAAKETGAEGPTLLGFAGSNVSCQAVNSLVAETWYSVFFLGARGQRLLAAGQSFSSVSG